MEIFLIRHTAVDLQNTCYGQSDVSLASSFEAELSDLKKKLPDLSDAKLYSSPLQRCFMLSRSLIEHDRIKTDERLMEMNFGNWELMEWKAIDQTSLNIWMENFVEVKCPGGESFQQLFERTTDFFKEVINQNDKKLILITHAGVIRCILSFVLGIPLQNAFKLQIGYGKISKLTVSEKLISVAFINY